MDLFAITINIVLVILSLSIASIGVRVGRLTGNLNWWMSFTFGWILIGIARSITAVTYSDFLPEEYFRNVSGFMVVVALIMMLFGMWGFSKTIISKVRKYE